MNKDDIGEGLICPECKTSSIREEDEQFKEVNDDTGDLEVVYVRLWYICNKCGCTWNNDNDPDLLDM